MAQKETDLATSLEQIGLSDKEAKVYLALLSLESSTAYEIALHCDVKKPTVYLILEDLRKKGLVLKVPHARKALYAARDISEYIAERRSKLNAVQALLPRLASLGGSGKPKIYFFTGLKGFAEAMDYKLESMRGKTFHSFYGSSVDSDSRVLDIYRRWTPQATEKGASLKIIMPQVDLGDFPDLKRLASEGKVVQIRKVAEYQQSSHLSIEIADDFVRIDDARNISNTIIDDKAAADALRSIFNIVWAKGQ